MELESITGAAVEEKAVPPFFRELMRRGCLDAGEIRAASDGFYANAIMVAAYYGFVALVLALAFYLDTRRAFAFKNKPSEICLANEKHRWAVYYALVIALLAGYIMQSGGFGSSGFGMYAGF